MNIDFSMFAILVLKSHLQSHLPDHPHRQQQSISELSPEDLGKGAQRGQGEEQGQGAPCKPQQGHDVGVLHCLEDANLLAGVCVCRAHCF